MAEAIDRVVDLRGTVLDRAHPEYPVPFDDLKGEPRNTDLVAVGRADRGSIAVSVEAKANEEFGDLIADVLMDGARKLALETPTHIVERIQTLMAAILPERWGGAPRLGELRYQLLTATAGALSYAKAERATAAVLIIHEFHTPRTSPSRHLDNQRDLDHFVSRLSQGRWAVCQTGGFVGPMLVKGNKWIPSDIPLWIGKIRRDVGCGSD
jgi:hypothetical protein